jgi:signal transduction histidine kinase
VSHSVLILSDDPEFAGAIMARWQAERSVPAFMLLSSAIWNDSLSHSCDLILLGSVQASFGPILKALESSGRPVICAGLDPAQVQRVRSSCPRMTVLRHHEGWVDAAVLLAAETLRRLEALARARRAEQALAADQADATLGRYMRDMRHNLNNALTSVLGNSELLLLEPGAFSAQQRDQISTMHTMAMRIHDILQRFSLMESEIHLARPSHTEMALIGEPAEAT